MKKAISKMTKAELLEELKSRPKDNITFSHNHLEQKVVFDRNVIDVMGDIAAAVLVGNRTLESLSDSISSGRVNVEAMVKIGTEVK